MSSTGDVLGGVESISRTVTCTGELSALIRVILRGKRLNTPRLDCHTW